MNFTLREKTQNELNERKKLTKLDVCPFEITMASGRKVEAWDLKESEIISLVKSNLEEGFVDGKRYAWSEQIIKSWSEKHPKVSANFLKQSFTLLEKDNANKSVFSLLGSLGKDQIAEARKQAEREKGKQNDFSPVTRDEILAELEETDRQELERVLQNNKTT